jgi:hydrogenase-4 component E
VTHMDPLVAAALLIGLCMAGLTQLKASLALYGAQTCLLGAMAVLHGWRMGEPVLVAAGLAVCVLKGLVVPAWLGHMARRIGCRRDDGLVLAPPLLMALVMGGLGAFALTPSLQALVPISVLPAMGLLGIGMLLMMTRRMAISQIIGFLVLENAVFLYTASQPRSMPLLVELGVLLDVLAGTMLAGMLTFRISETFEHVDVARMKELRG